MKKQLKAKLNLIALMAIFIVPMLMAYWIYQGGHWPQATTNHGHLMNPTTPLSKFKFSTAHNKETFDNKALEGQWWLVYVSNNKCMETCQHGIYQLRQIHTALGKNAHRVDRLFISANQLAEHLELGALEQYYPKKHIAYSDPKTISELFQLQDNTDRIYLVDPLGNLVMFYNNAELDKGVLKDLQHLLKISQIG